MPYTQPTLDEAQTALANRLNDQDNIRWVVDELTVYLREALRTWNAWTQFYRSTESFVTMMLQAIYDLPTVIPVSRAYTVTTWEMIADLQYALLEPAAPGGTWAGTDQFTLEQLTTAIQRRRDQFLRETGAVLTYTQTVYALPAVNGRLPLDEAVLVIRSAGWRDTATQLLLPLQRTDEWAANNFQPLWSTSPEAPYAYSTTVTQPITLQLIPPASGPGTLDLIAIQKSAPIDPLVSSLLGVPDDWAWVIKYGALADLLSGDGLSLDPGRQAYCEMRWQQGIDGARRASVVLTARINDLPCTIAAMSDADQYSPTWALLGGEPQQLLLAGQNLVATWPPPGGGVGPWTIGMDIVANMVVPSGTDPTEVLMVSADTYDSVLDLAQHLALFKEGPGQIELAQSLLERAARAAGVTLKFQQASQPDRAQILGQQQQDRRSVAEQLRDVVGVPVED